MGGLYGDGSEGDANSAVQAAVRFKEFLDIYIDPVAEGKGEGRRFAGWDLRGLAGVMDGDGFSAFVRKIRLHRHRTKIGDFANNYGRINPVGRVFGIFFIAEIVFIPDSAAGRVNAVLDFPGNGDVHLIFVFRDFLIVEKLILDNFVDDVFNQEIRVGVFLDDIFDQKIVFGIRIGFSGLIFPIEGSIPPFDSFCCLNLTILS